MPCHSCACEFGLLKKEVGCEICGFSFCKKCCSKKTITLQNIENFKKLICNKCYENMASNKTSSTGSISPPLAHKKRMAVLKKQSFSVDSSHDYQWDNEKDREISERLQRLKRDRQKEHLPSEMEIEERLAKLKGMDPSKYNAPPIMVYRPADRRSSVEQAHDLMKQVREEACLDAKLVKPEDEIAARLARLRDQPVPNKQIEEEEIIVPTLSHLAEQANRSEEMDIDTEAAAFQREHAMAEDQAMGEMQQLNKNKDFKKLLATLKTERGSEDEKNLKEEADDEEEANRLIEQLMAASVNEDEMSDLDSFNHAQVKDDAEKKSAMPDDDEEFPWCVICTEDAKMRCFGCDNDLYCINCFKECHDSLDLKEHRTCPYFAPKDPLA